MTDARVGRWDRAEKTIVESRSDFWQSPDYRLSLSDGLRDTTRRAGATVNPDPSVMRSEVASRTATTFRMSGEVMAPIVTTPTSLRHLPPVAPENRPPRSIFEVTPARLQRLRLFPRACASGDLRHGRSPENLDVAAGVVCDAEDFFMTTHRPIRAGRPGRGWKSLGLIAVSLVAFGLEGCASMRMGGNGCSTGKCGGFLSKCKLFHRRATSSAIAVDSCDPSLGVSTFEGAEGGIITPGPVMSAPPGTDLDPIIQPNLSPAAPSGTGTGTSGANSGAVKSLYQAQRGEPREARREVSKPKSDPLADLPALIVPGDSNTEVSPPVAPSAGDPPSAGVAPSANDLPAGPGVATSGLAPGIRRFKVIEPRLAAGSQPTEAGWKWLFGLGYRTVLDLRETSEIRQGELAEIDHQGLRYLSLPISKVGVDPARVKTFEDAIAREEDRPIFIFDDDGARPASLAFLHLVLTKKTDRRLAEREVEDLGASDSPLWRTTLKYLASQPASTVDKQTDSDTRTVAMLPAIEAPSPFDPPASSSILTSFSTMIQLGVKTLANLPAETQTAKAAPAGSGG